MREQTKPGNEKSPAFLSGFSGAVGAPGGAYVSRAAEGQVLLGFCSDSVSTTFWLWGLG